MKYKKSAFTMIELIMAIVVMGILAAMALPRMERDLRQEAADNILSAVRYTQHMSLMDNVETPGSDQWQRKYWRFGLSSCSGSIDTFYYVASDKDMGGGVGNTEAAIDPSNGKIMLGDTTTDCDDGINNNASPQIFISHKYGVENNVSFSCTNNKYIGFDNLGRPHVDFGNADLAGAGASWDTPMSNDCNITFSFEDGSSDLIVTIEKETGRAFIAD